MCHATESGWPPVAFEQLRTRNRKNGVASPPGEFPCLFPIPTSRSIIPRMGGHATVAQGRRDEHQVAFSFRVDVWDDNGNSVVQHFFRVLSLIPSSAVGRSSALQGVFT